MTELEKVLSECLDLRHVWLTVHEINENPPFATDLYAALISQICIKLHIKTELAIKVQAAYIVGRNKHLHEFYKAFQT